MEPRWRIELFGNLCARQESAAERSLPHSPGPRPGHPAHGEGPGEAEAPVRVITHFQTKTGTLLAYLAYYRNRTHQREALVELLWPECEPAVGRNNLSVSLTWLRRQMEPPTLILADRTSVWLNPDAVTTDVAEFEDALQAAVRAGGSRERGALLSRAVELYRGEFLTGYFADWILSERGWLAERYFQALQQWVSYLEQAGELERALEAARRGVILDPLREETHRDVIRLYAALGQPAA